MGLIREDSIINLPKWLWVVPTALLAFGHAAESEGSGPAYFSRKPASFSALVRQSQTQETLLQNRSYVRASEFSDFWGQVADPGLSQSLRLRGEQITGQYEWRREHHLSSLDDDVLYNQRVNKFFYEEVFGEIQKYQIEKKAGELRRATLHLATETDDYVFKKVRDPITMTVAVIGIATGKPLTTRVGPLGLMTTQTAFTLTDPVVKFGYARVGIAGNLVASSFEFDNKAVEIREPSRARAGDDAHKRERFKLGVSRDINFLGLGTGFQYGSSSSMMTASLTRRLTSTIVCLVDSARAIFPERADPESLQSRVQLQYSYSF